MIRNSGTATAPINIKSYDTGKAEIRAGTGNGILLHNCQYVRVDNLKVTGSGVSNGGFYNDGISLLHDDNSATRLNSIYISSVETSLFRGVGISFYASGTSAGFNDLQVTDSDSHGNGYAGMWMGGDVRYPFTGVDVAYSKFHDNNGSATISGQSGNGLFFKQVDGGTIEHCLAYNNGTLNTAPNGPVGLWALLSNNVIIQFCESYFNHTLGGDGDGFDLDGGMTNSVMHYNYSHGNDGTGFLVYSFDEDSPVENNTVRYNISENDGRTNGQGSLFIGGCSGCLVSNLNVYNKTMYAGSFGTVNSSYFATVRIKTARFSNVRIMNNILVSDAGVPLVNSKASTGLMFNGNDYFSRFGAPFRIRYGGVTYTSLAAFRVTGNERLSGANTGLQVDPRLVSPGTGGTIGDTNLLYTSERLQTPACFANDRCRAEPERVIWNLSRKSGFLWKHNSATSTLRHWG